MPKFNTGNPVGSTDPRDLSDSAQVADELINGQSPAYPDRLGKSRKSWAGVESQAAQQDAEFSADQASRNATFTNFLNSSGFEYLGAYAAGIEFTEYNQYVVDGGEAWFISPSQALPYTTSGAGVPEGGALMTRGEALLRQEIGSGVVRADSIAALQALAGRFDGDAARLVSGTGRDGDFRWNASDLSGTLILSSVTSTSVDSATDTITSAGHGLVNGGGVVSQSSVNGLSTDTVYWVVNATVNTFQLSATFGGAAFDLTGTTNFTVDHLLDPLKGVYVTSASDLTGTVGAWVRQDKSPSRFEWFGAVGDGVTDDTSALDSSGASGLLSFVGRPGKTYLINGGIIFRSNAFKIDLNGATVKLKDSAASKQMLRFSGTNSGIVNGYIDGNKANGNTPGSLFDSVGIALYGDNCYCRRNTIEDVAGIPAGIYNANDCSVEGNTISGTLQYGVYGDASTQIVLRPRVINNTIDTSEGGNNGQGVLLTPGGTGNSVDYYQISGNTITGPQGAGLTDQAINIAARGSNGVIYGNTTRYGSMGVSEGGEGCVISGNNFLDLQGTFKYGIEPSGKCVISGNFVTSAIRSVILSGAHDFSGTVISGNNLISSESTHQAIYIQTDASGDYTNISISGNNSKGNRGVQTSGTGISGLSINGNNLTGFGVGVSGTRGVFLDSPQASAEVAVIGNKFSGFERPYAIFSSSALTVTDFYISGNFCTTDITTGDRINQEGSAVVGANCKILGINNEVKQNIYDVGSDRFWEASTTYNNPEGLLVGGIGSFFTSLNSAGGAYYKASGAGNTGWIRIDV